MTGLPGPETSGNMRNDLQACFCERLMLRWLAQLRLSRSINQGTRTGHTLQNRIANPGCIFSGLQIASAIVFPQTTHREVFFTKNFRSKSQK